MRRYLAATAALAVLAALSPAANAGTATTRSKWKNCENGTAGTMATVTFPDVARAFGANRYMVKKEIKWQVLIGSGRWRTDDHTTTKTEWLQVGNPDYDVVSSIGDRTGWGNEYGRRWRAVVTFKLIQNRRGPVDRKVDEVQLFLHKGLFAEQGNCGAPRTPDSAPGFA